MDADLESRFRALDPQGTGMIKKADFVNVLFESAKGIQASELIGFMNVFTTSFDEIINYDEFLKLLYRFGSGAGGHEGQ